MTTYQELAEFYASAPSEDAVLQFNATTRISDPLRNPIWHDAMPNHAPDLTSNLKLFWRWKPIKKSVDMAVLVNSGIDCRYICRGCNDWRIIQLNEKTQTQQLEKLQPRMDYWFYEDNLTEVAVSGGLINHYTRVLEEAGFKVWSDSIASVLMIEGLQDGYCWPWEV